MTEKYPVYEIRIERIHEIYVDVFKKWCEENCTETFNIRSSLYSGNRMVLMYVTFVDQEDAAAFKLKWM